jgi:hypothetical protein
MDIRTAMACLNGTLHALNEETNKEVISYFLNDRGKTTSQPNILGNNINIGKTTDKSDDRLSDDHLVNQHEAKDDSDDEIILINKQSHPMNTHIIKYLNELISIYNTLKKDNTELVNCVEWLKQCK